MITSNPGAIAPRTERPRRRITIAVGVLAATVAVAASAVLAGPAAAATTTQGSSYFHFPAWKPNSNNCTNLRRVKLAAGNYSHDVWVRPIMNRSHISHDTLRSEFYPAGFYRWRVCVRYETDGPDGYVVHSALHPENPPRGKPIIVGSKKMYIAFSMDNDKKEFGSKGRDGWYEWGATLQFLGRR